MKWVDLVEFDAAARKGKVLVRATLEGGTVRLEGDPDLVARLEKGVNSWSEKKRMKPEDGEGFLKALGEEYRNAYLFATDVQEGEKPEPYETPAAKPVPPAEKPVPTAEKPTPPKPKGPPPIPDDAR